MEVYRAFDQDVNDNREVLSEKRPLSIPVLAIGGEISTSGSIMKDMMLEVSSIVRYVSC
ncbi:hypothetical protein H7F33_02850 [Pedobacter sp. PAMC26386]|nr:hypothetical protein H7F33_02850 [Pedobacter sp. PAMC26386]